MNNYLQRLVSRAADLPTPLRPRGAAPLDSPFPLEAGSQDQGVEIDLPLPSTRSEPEPGQPAHGPLPTRGDTVESDSGDSSQQPALDSQPFPPAPQNIQPAPGGVKPLQPRHMIVDVAAAPQQIFRPAAEGAPPQPAPSPPGALPRPAAASPSIRAAESHADTPPISPTSQSIAASSRWFAHAAEAPAVEPAPAPLASHLEPGHESRQARVPNAEPPVPAAPSSLRFAADPSAAEADPLKVIEQILVREAGSQQTPSQRVSDRETGDALVRETIVEPPAVQVRIGQVEVRGAAPSAPVRPGRSGFADLELARRYLDRSGY